MPKRTAEFILSAKDEATSTISKVEAKVQSLGGIFGKLAGVAGPALAAIGVGFSVKGIADMIQHANDLTDSLRDSSIRLGVGIGDLQAYRLAAGNAGIGVEQLDGLIAKMNKTVGEIKLNTSSKETVAAFDRIGISVADVKKSNPAEIFEKVIEGLGGIEDPAVRAATTMQIFGKSGQAALTLVNDGASSLSDSKKLLKDLGLELTEIDGSKVDAANDSIGTLSKVLEAAKQKLGADLAPLISGVGDLLRDAAKDGHDFGKDIAEGVEWAGNAADRLWSGMTLGWNASAQVFHLLEAGIQELASMILDFGADSVDVVGTKIPDALNDFLRGTEDVLTTLKQGFADFGNSIGNSVISGINTAEKSITGLVNSSIESINTVIKKGNELAGSDLISPIGKLNEPDQISPLESPKVEPIKFDFEIPKFGQETQDWLRDLADTYEKASSETMEKAADNAELVNQSWNEIISSDGGKIKQFWDDVSNKVQDVNKHIGGGDDYSGGSGIPGATDHAAHAIKDKVPKMIEQFNLLEEAGKSVSKNLESAIDDFTKTGELNFKKFTASVLQDIASIMLKAAILGEILGNSKYGGNGSILGFGSSSSWGQTISGFFSGFSGVPKATLVAEGSYDGGGFTGFGSRSGGLDGKGGFAAVLHPNESVIDHTKGQNIGGGDTHLYQTVIIKETLPAGQAQALMKATKSATMSEMRSVNQRGGKRRDDFFGRR